MTCGRAQRGESPARLVLKGLPHPPQAQQGHYAPFPVAIGQGDRRGGVPRTRQERVPLVLGAGVLRDDKALEPVLPGRWRELTWQGPMAPRGVPSWRRGRHRSRGTESLLARAGTRGPPRTCPREDLSEWGGREVRGNRSEQTLGGGVQRLPGVPRAHRPEQSQRPDTWGRTCDRLTPEEWQRRKQEADSTRHSLAMETPGMSR